MFAGTCDGRLVAAGGANFPNGRPWDGGRKVWHDTVFALDRPEARWHIAGRLPRPLGYGVSATHGGSVVCAGGSDADSHYAECFRLQRKGDAFVTTPLPALPKPIANACGAMIGATLYVAGGQEKPDSTAALRSLFALDLDAADPRWRELQPIPGAGRIFATAAACGGALYVAGGAELRTGDDGKVQRRYLKDAYRYDHDKGWTRIADLPAPLAAAASPAVSDGAGFLVLGGDDGSQVGVRPADHRGFRRTMLRYDPAADAWRDAGEFAGPRLPPVTAPLVKHDGAWVLISGEVLPGIRTPEVWRIVPAKKE